ncbi:MAG TPA: excinuclease ABC subunit UvrA, partial [bacterium]|nr:excinuclease ABC subunit UvrA [bacterium]
QKILTWVRQSGFVKVRVDGKFHDVDEEIKLARYKAHTIEVLVDRFRLSHREKDRVAEGVETGLKIGKGLLLVVSHGQETLYNEQYGCARCGTSFEELTPRLFSFNSPYGACQTCKGLGFLMKIDPDLVIPDRQKTFRQGAVKPWQDAGGRGLFLYYRRLLRSVLDDLGYSLDDRPVDLTREALTTILYGSEELGFEGVIPNLERLFHQTESEHRREEISRYIREVTCPACHGGRLRPESLAVRIAGKSIVDVTGMSVTEARQFFEKLPLDGREEMIARPIFKEIISRLNFMEEVGLEYLTLDRMTHTLSGGEAERIRLATQIGSGLVGVVYILDEPTIGLHQRDNTRLIATLKRLRDLGNTVVVVEHDEETIRNADYVVDLGPGAGKHGGQVVAAGTVEEVARQEQSLTGRYLSGQLRIAVPRQRRLPEGKYLQILNARHNNLKGINVKIPLGVFVCVTGVSGSGKSSLIQDVFCRALKRLLYRSREEPGQHDAILGVEYISKIVEIDQSPIGRTPRSNPATYTGAFTLIRDIFSRTEEARIRGYKPGRFSFNVKGGRCEACAGDGITRIEMHFLPDIYIPCDVCKGKRYNRETLEVTYRGKNIAEVLEMKVEEALEFFRMHPALREKLQTLYDVGLDYLELGQPATTLSGGEAQRVKLAAELSRRGNERTVYVLDEPTVGLHLADIERLLAVLNRLVEKGSTVIVIEHNLDVIKCADHLIDLGPEGGDKGGKIVAEGTPEEVMANPRSYTGQFLRSVLTKS